MNSISGKIVVRESGLGIPNLVVVAYDVDPSSEATEEVAPGSAGPHPAIVALHGPGSLADRIGSAITDEDGAFELTYADDAFKVGDAHERRPDILLMVLAPEDAVAAPDSGVLFTSRTVREDAGRTEQFVIRLPTQQLELAGVLSPPRPFRLPEALADPGSTTEARRSPSAGATPVVFLSYASADRARVIPIVRALEKAGVEVWIDVSDIPGGANYGLEIAQRIKDCAALVIACSAQALASRNVRQEIQLAWKYQRPYLPLCLEATTFPPEIEYWLEGSQWVEILDRPEEEWLSDVLRALGQLPAFLR